METGPVNLRLALSALRPAASEVDVHDVADGLPAEGAAVLVQGLAHQDVGAVAAQAEVPAGQQQDRLGAVLADDALLPLLVLLEQGQQAVRGGVLPLQGPVRT